MFPDRILLWPHITLADLERGVTQDFNLRSPKMESKDDGFGVSGLGFRA